MLKLQPFLSLTFPLDDLQTKRSREALITGKAAAVFSVTGMPASHILWFRQHLSCVWVCGCLYHLFRPGNLRRLLRSVKDPELVEESAVAGSASVGGLFIVAQITLSLVDYGRHKAKVQFGLGNYGIFIDPPADRSIDRPATTLTHTMYTNSS